MYIFIDGYYDQQMRSWSDEQERFHEDLEEEVGL